MAYIKLSKGKYIRTRKTTRTEDLDIQNSLSLQPIQDGYSITANNPNKAFVIEESLKTINTSILAPSNLSLVNNNFNKLSWDEVDNAEGYEIYFNDELLAYSTTNTFLNSLKEINGSYKIRAYTRYAQSELSEPLMVKSIPTNPTFVSVNSNWVNGNLQLIITWKDNSEIEDRYELRYKIDGGTEQTLTLEANTTTTTLMLSNISKSIEFNIYAINDIGENGLVNPVTLYLTPSIDWAYKTDTNAILLSWLHNIEVDGSYKIKYKVNNGDYKYLEIPVTSIYLNDYVETSIALSSTEEAELSMCYIIDGIEHIWSQPIKISATLDDNLKPPTDFTASFVDYNNGDIKFEWTDSHTTEIEYELLYSINGELSQKVIIPSTTQESTGTKYSYPMHLDSFGTITAKVRMRWRLGYSEYTTQKSLAYLNINEVPPSWLKRVDTSEDIVSIYWEAQNYIDHYEVHIINTDTEEENILTTTEDKCDLKLIDIANKNIEVKIKSYFINGRNSDFSNSLSIKIRKIDNTFITNMISYGVKSENHLITSITGFGVKSSVDLITNIITKCKYETPLVIKYITPMILTYAPLETISNCKQVTMSEGTILTNIKNTNIKFIDKPLVTTIYAITKSEYYLAQNIYTPTKSEYPLETEIHKIRIVCFGDSLTSGHPKYWELQPLILSN